MREALKAVINAERPFIFSFVSFPLDIPLRALGPFRRPLHPIF